jgi:uncharacterized membrane protein YcaP (DUF421 family)
MFFNSWQTIGETIILGTLAYIGVVASLRISGKRTLSQMDAFDLVVTVAVGSILATIILDSKVVLLQGLTAVAVLVILQVLAAWLAIKSRTMQKIIKADPELLYYKGQLFENVMKKKRILKEEILHSARANGINSLDEVEAVILEPDGSISFIEKIDRSEQSTLSGVEGMKE